MECYNHLTEWEPLQYCSTVNIDSQLPPDLKKMWSDPFYEVITLFILYCITCDLNDFISKKIFKYNLTKFFIKTGDLSSLHDSQ